MAAWFRGGETEIPRDVRDFGIEGRKYTVAMDENGVLLAVYRIRPHDGILMRMKQFPEVLGHIMRHEGITIPETQAVEEEETV
jgi:hypothetical protein